MSKPRTVPSTRSSLSESPYTSVSSIDSPLLSDSISDLPSSKQHRRFDSDNITNSSDSDQPMTPWNLRPNLDATKYDQQYCSSSSDDDASQYLGHNRWKQSHGVTSTPGQHYKALSTEIHNTNGNSHADRVVVHRRVKSKSRYVTRNVHHERPNLSRDFFLIVIFCFVLACFLFCLARPAFASWIYVPTGFFDEF